MSYRYWLSAVVALLLVPTSALGFSAKVNRLDHHLRTAVIHLHGKRAPGRDIVKYGLTNGKMPTHRQIHKYFHTLRRMKAPYTVYLHPKAPYRPPAGSGTLRTTSAPLSGIRACESGGNYGAVSPGGTYRGAYQFDYQTWHSIGGTGDPAAASPAEQDRLAAKLYAQRGSRPWPVCG